MDLLTDCVLRSALTASKDVFGERCTFLRFEADDQNHYDWSSGFQSLSRFGRIVYRRDDEEVPLYSDRLVLKVTPSRPLMKAFSVLQFSNEIFFYTRILPFFETHHRPIVDLFPRYYNGLVQCGTLTDEAVIIFENVQARGYVSKGAKSYLDYDHLTLMLRKLAEFHACSYRAKQRDPDMFYALTGNLLETNGTVLNQFTDVFFDTVFRGFERLSEDSRYASSIAKLRAIFDNREFAKYALTGDKRNDAHVLCHGDFLRSNVLFKYENGRPVDMKLVDMATCRYASPSLDLAMVLYLNADQRMRRENWDRLIDEYCAALRDTLHSCEVPSRDTILTEFKRTALYVYFVASYFLPTLIAEDRTNASMSDGLEPTFAELKERVYNDVSAESWKNLLKTIGGEEGTAGVADILQDILDRNFVPV